MSESFYRDREPAGAEVGPRERASYARVHEFAPHPMYEPHLIDQRAYNDLVVAELRRQDAGIEVFREAGDDPTHSQTLVLTRPGLPVEVRVFLAHWSRPEGISDDGEDMHAGPAVDVSVVTHSVLGEETGSRDEREDQPRIGQGATEVGAYLAAYMRDQMRRWQGEPAPVESGIATYFGNPHAASGDFARDDADCKAYYAADAHAEQLAHVLSRSYGHAASVWGHCPGHESDGTVMAVRVGGDPGGAHHESLTVLPAARTAGDEPAVTVQITRSTTEPGVGDPRDGDVVLRRVMRPDQATPSALAALVDASKERLTLTPAPSLEPYPGRQAVVAPTRVFPARLTVIARLVSAASRRGRADRGSPDPEEGSPRRRAHSGPDPAPPVNADRRVR